MDLPGEFRRGQPLSAKEMNTISRSIRNLSMAISAGNGTPPPANQRYYPTCFDKRANSYSRELAMQTAPGFSIIPDIQTELWCDDKAEWASRNYPKGTRKKFRWVIKKGVVNANIIGSCHLRVTYNYNISGEPQYVGGTEISVPYALSKGSAVYFFENKKQSKCRCEWQDEQLLPLNPDYIRINPGEEYTASAYIAFPRTINIDTEFVGNTRSVIEWKLCTQREDDFFCQCDKVGIWLGYVKLVVCSAFIARGDLRCDKIKPWQTRETEVAWHVESHQRWKGDVSYPLMLTQNYDIYHFCYEATKHIFYKPRSIVPNWEAIPEESGDQNNCNSCNTNCYPPDFNGGLGKGYGYFISEPPAVIYFKNIVDSEECSYPV